MSDPNDRNPYDPNPNGPGSDSQGPEDQSQGDQGPHDAQDPHAEARRGQGGDAAEAALRALGVRESEALASQLVWRVGRLADDGPVTVRVGFATSARLFADLPKLKNASDHEVETAIEEGEIRVEWVGQSPA